MFRGCIGNVSSVAADVTYLKRCRLIVSCSSLIEAYQVLHAFATCPLQPVLPRQHIVLKRCKQFEAKVPAQREAAVAATVSVAAHVKCTLP